MSSTRTGKRSDAARRLTLSRKSARALKYATRPVNEIRVGK